MPRRGEMLADRLLLERPGAQQGRDGTEPGADEGLDGGSLRRRQVGPARGILFGMAISAALWALIGLAVLTWAV